MTAELSKERLESCAVRVEMGARATTEGILVVGQALSEARAEFGERDQAFGEWREKRLPWLDRATALRWIQTWNKFGNSLHHNVADQLSPTVLYLLSAPSTPEPAIAAVTARAEAGEKIDVKAVKAEIEKAKSAEAAAKTEAEHVKADLKSAQGAYRNLLFDNERLERELKARPIVEKPVERIVEKTVTVTVIPDGYADEKAALADLKKKQEKAQQDVSATYERKQRAAAELAELEERLRKYSASEKESSSHDEVLLELSRVLVTTKPVFDFFEHGPVPEKKNKWRDCATSFRLYADDIERWLDQHDCTVIDSRLIEGAA